MKPQPRALAEDDFARIAAAGFDSVRIPVGRSGHTGPTQPFAIDKAFQARADWAVTQALAHGLIAIVSIQQTNELYAAPKTERRRLMQLWQQRSAHYKNHREILYFDVLNEPHAKPDAALLNDYLADAIAVIRKEDPRRG